MRLYFTFVGFKEIIWVFLGIMTMQLILLTCDVFFALCWQQEHRFTPRSMLSSSAHERRAAATPTAATQNGHQEKHKQDVRVWGTSCTEWRQQQGKHQSWQEAFVASAGLCGSSGERPRNFFLLKFCPATKHRKPECVTWRKFARFYTWIKSQLQLNITWLFRVLFFLYTVKKNTSHTASAHRTLMFYLDAGSFDIQSVELCTLHHMGSTSQTHKQPHLTTDTGSATPEVQNMAVTHVLGSKGRSRQNFSAHLRKENVHLGASHWALRGKEKGGSE